jgi:biopolymer transport protein ExbD
MPAHSPVVSVEPQLNATPLIDVLLVLLVMLIFTLPIATHSVRMNLPQLGNGPPSPAVRVDILYGGDIYWDGELVASLDEIEPKLRALAARSDAPMVKVIPERRAPYGRVAQVLAAAQRSHVAKLTVTPVPDP